jgi:rod shape-determining protein MreC
MTNKESFLKKYRRGVITFGILFLSFLSLLVQNTGFIQGIEQGGASSLFVFQNIFGNIGSWFQDTIGSIEKLQNLEDENQLLRNQIQDYQGLEQRMLELQQENALLSQQLDLSMNPAYDTETAEIIAKDPSNYYQTFTINKGYSDGIRVNMPVVAAQGGYYGLVGKVIQVGLGSAQIRPVTDPQNIVASRFFKTRYEGLVQGIGDVDLRLRMDYVPKSAQEQIRFGDLIITSGLSSLYPKGIALGRVEEVRPIEYESSLRIFLKPVIDFNKLEYVAVILEAFSDLEDFVEY